MSVKPIIFSGPMVRAILDGRKNQTRRVLKPAVMSDEWPQVMWPIYVNGERVCEGSGDPEMTLLPAADGGVIWSGPTPIVPGDVFWCRETWSHTGQGVWSVSDAQIALSGRVIYRADDDAPGVGWFPSIHMPRRFCRLTLVVTNVRVQRVQDISEEDALAEGIERLHFPERGDWGWPQRRFRDLWDSINAKRSGGAYAWDKNPWVVAITFEPHRMNVDAYLAQREAA